jgi:HK97 family phage major capsid protein
VTKAQKLRSDAQQAHTEARAIWTRHEGTNTEHSPDELAQFDALTKRAQDLVTQAEGIEARENTLNALDQAARNGAPAGHAGLPHNDARNTRNGRHGYSLLRAIRAQDPQNKGDALSGIEKEVHDELTKRRSPGQRAAEGVMVPWDLQVDTESARRFARANGIERRDLTTTTGAGAVMTVTLPTMIELLRNASLMVQLGSKVLSDMEGNFAIPRQTGAGTTYWVNPESSTITKSNQTIDSVSYTPRTLGIQTVYSRTFLRQTGIDAEMFVREDQALSMAVGLDGAGIAGSGSGYTPTGILYDSGVNVVAVGTNGGAPTWALIAQCERGVDVGNALNGSLHYVTSAKGRYKLKTTVKDSNTAAKYLWNEDENTVNGYPAWSTNQIPTNLTKGTGTNLTGLVFGNFQDALFALWGGQDLIVNPYTGSNAGAVELTTLQDADFHVRHGASFSVIKDLDPS